MAAILVSPVRLDRFRTAAIAALFAHHSGENGLPLPARRRGTDLNRRDPSFHACFRDFAHFKPTRQFFAEDRGLKAKDIRLGPNGERQRRNP
jgi:hypothetical protein